MISDSPLRRIVVLTMESDEMNILASHISTTSGEAGKAV